MARKIFSVSCLGSSQRLLTTNQFLGGTIFFRIINISIYFLELFFLSAF